VDRKEQRDIRARPGEMVDNVHGVEHAEFGRRFIEDESFWMYRLWV
jgi:hypothetical protein